MITTEEVVGLLDVYHLVGLDNQGRELLTNVLTARGSNALLADGAWSPVLAEPFVLNWSNTRGVMIGQDADLWLYKVELFGLFWRATCSGPNREDISLPRADSWPKAQLICEQHRRSRRAAAPVTSGG
ncbi:hypothetical protein FZI85_24975 [Mycobacterium sp. CBMA293]|uniref:hypothetical protein n=1 Tax=unclassified Mycolicibacterium TaxID=2636767 RepID=UPI0012DD20E0|nr:MULTISPECIES: hypothetical protein [unclassified Mycolicibacterium]MUL47570.1 hypothetical protein [Mycolicibacterium sp. CBMA 360]MUL61912.1 hypothetical protein [Mycolicibacterium sp. CBMA 335]MUL68985.1 hypothetical protein [Mycolicibacterium sp. CBMA 311]MUL92798.1 hypothetical protein [Mycolicibacterium sp. CBMA 230]MUM08760.1 hypothetical protein [Mycolicibacterium sp. CBMA 213]